ncbi:zinc finger BED domain-containing protein RICESLEEPER 1-like [Vicia villosa]|uniref:zinc finger BED domain-containing protein RICESLEEPER 1-like n=1 Tax=Vicia villosa TaxID=3911 RepID=UPI00273CEDD5|nr:zinc finger BED domain-containing protein RICESLEEPER 1-like [Vicia villosa]
MYSKKIKNRNHDKGQPFLLPTISEGKQELGIGTYNPENVKKLIAEAIIMHDYPLSIVDHVSLKRVFVSLQPLFKVPTRNTIKKEVLKVYDFEKKYATKMLDSHEGRVAVTTDMWTSSKKKGYMELTAHYIDGSWTLQSQILRFIYVPAPHTSERLAEALVNCLMDWNIDSKLCTVTLDNCSTNDSMIRKIKDKLSLESLIMDGSLLHMCCCAHILILIVQEGIQVIKDGIENIWDSWKFAKDVCECLKLFNEVTELISGTKYPTANLYFPKICKIKLAIEEWKMSSNSIIEVMATKMMKKFQNYWSGVHDMMGVDAVLDPRKKMAVLNFWFPKLYGEDSSAQVSRIREMCYDLLNDYQQIKLRDAQPTSPSIGTTTVVDDEAEFDAYIETIADNSSSSVKYELDHHLKEPVIKKTPEFDILNWWKVNGVVYPTLQAISRDVLVIPISTVASESAFSNSGRILSLHRSRLNWTTVEALMCARSWLWAAQNNETSRVTEEIATVLNEMESDDEGIL